MKPLALVVIGFAALTTGCKKDEPSRGDPPPPPPVAAKSGACQTPGNVDDPVSAGFFPKTMGSFCIDPSPGSVRTYGAQAKLSMDEVCTTAFDGECEVYKRYGLKRVVTMRYIDGAGGGGVVEVVLSQFDGDAGAYGMFTKRVVADADPAAETAPKSVPAVGAAAIGGGRASAWRGAHLIELVYMNEQEPPAKMVKSSEAILPQLAKSMTDKLPGNTEKPGPAKALPEANLVPLGVQFAPKDVLGIKGLSPTATGFYKDGDKRYRTVVASYAAPADASGPMELVMKMAGALPVAGLGDQAFHLLLQESKTSPKVEWVFARKGPTIMAIGDEELVLTPGQPLDAQKNLRLTKDEKIAKLKASLK